MSGRFARRIVTVTAATLMTVTAATGVAVADWRYEGAYATAQACDNQGRSIVNSETGAQTWDCQRRVDTDGDVTWLLSIYYS